MRLKTLSVALLVFATLCSSLGQGAKGVFSSRPSVQTSAFLHCVDPASTVTVRVQQRLLDAVIDLGPLEIDVSKPLKMLSDDAVHYHLWVYDAEGNPIDNFGWRKSSDGDGEVFSERYTRALNDYDPQPKAEGTMPYADYVTLVNQFRYNEQKSGYSLSNNGITDYKSVKIENGRESYNCQPALKKWWDAAKNIPAFNETIPFSWPSGNVEAISTAASLASAAVDVGKTLLNGSFAPYPTTQTLQNNPVATQSSPVNLGIKDSGAGKHYCLDFEFVREQKVSGMKIYRCKECGQETPVSRNETIEDVIAKNQSDKQFNESRMSSLQSVGAEDASGNITVPSGGIY